MGSAVAANGSGDVVIANAGPIGEIIDGVKNSNLSPNAYIISGNGSTGTDTYASGLPTFQFDFVGVLFRIRSSDSQAFACRSITQTMATGNINVTGGQLWVLDSGTPPNLPSIRLGVTEGSTGNFTMSDGSVLIDGAVDSGFAIGDLLVGDNGNGNLTMTGGELSANDEIFIGFNPTSKGVVNVNGGTFRTTGRSIIAGFVGDGTLNVSDSANVVANFDLLVGFVEGSKGAFNLSGGTVTANFLFSNRLSGGAGGTAVITQTGGTFNANIAYVLGQAVGTTTMNHSGGAINAINPDGIGGDYVVGDGGGNTSTYNISGTADVYAQANVMVGVFEGSNGTINQTGGTITAGNNLRIGGDGVGTWNLSAGVVNTKNIFLGDFDSSFGTMNVSGGVLNLSSDLNVGGALASNAPPAARPS